MKSHHAQSHCAFVSIVLASFCSIASPVLAQTPAAVTIHSDRPFPESITSTPDGALIIGSIAKGAIFRAAPGATTAEQWIAPGTNGLDRVLGVLADPKSNTLWACSIKANKSAPTALKTFDLKTGATKASYDFPDNDGICNDIAIAADGTAYATDTKNGRIVRLKPKAATLDVWIKDPQLIQADGIGFGDNATLFVNTFDTSHLYRVRIGKDGAPGTVEPLKTSSPLDHPDGIRHLTANSFLMIEGAGRLDLVTVSGDTATIKVLKDGFTGPTAVTQVDNTAWVLEGKLSFMDKLNQDPGPFQAHPVPLPK